MAKSCSKSIDDDGASDNSQLITGSSEHDAILCEILGLSSLDVVTFQDDEVVVEKYIMMGSSSHEGATARATTTTTANQQQPHQQNAKSNQQTVPIRLRLPRNVSRYFYSPKHCCAYTIPHLFTKEECQALINTATLAAQFDYVQTATHKASDGSQLSVKLQHPNPHKLAVFTDSTWVQTIWRRLRPFFVWNDDDDKNHNNNNTIILQDMINRDGIPLSKMTAGINPRLRIVKYDADDNDEFQPHFDATTTTTMTISSKDDEKSAASKTITTTSLITVLLYLNQGGGMDFEGGETVFLSNRISQGQHNWLNITNQEEKKNSGDHNNDDDDKILGDFQTPTTTSLTPSTGTVVVFEHDLYHCGRPLKWGTKYVLRTDVMFQLSIEELEMLRLSRNNNNKNASFEIDDEKGEEGHETYNPTTTECSPKTVQHLVDDFFLRKDNKFSQLHGPFCNALSELGLLVDTSIESFCTPGRFALHAMMQDVLLLYLPPTAPPQPTAESKGDHKGSIHSIINRLLDAAFLTLKEAAK